MRKELELLREETEAIISEGIPAETIFPRYASIIEKIGVKIQQLKPLARNGFVDREEEIAFFKKVWPFLYGKLFFYIHLHKYEMFKRVLPNSTRTALIRLTERRITEFFRENKEFCIYYLSGSRTFDELFTRDYSLNYSFDELALVIDPESATVSSHRAAWCLAYNDLKDYFENEKKVLELTPADEEQPVYTWKETKSAAVELIKSQAEAGSIFIDGKPATAAQLKKEFEAKYAQDLKEFDKLLYATDTKKMDPTPYLSKLMKAFIGRKVRLRK